MVEKWKLFPKIRNKKGCPLSSLLVNIVLATAVRQEKERKFTQIGKEEVKLSLFVSDIILNRENPNDSTKK